MATLSCETPVADCVKEWLDKHSGWIDTEKVFEFECLVDQYAITSPPEQLFACVWCHCFAHHGVDFDPQQEVGRYRIDFVVSPFAHFVSGLHDFPDDMLRKIGEKLTRYAIEIDGFEWHDKTPEQAERDKKRERYIQSQGYTVLRFAAREVLRDPLATASEVWARVKADIGSIYAQLTFR